MAKQVRDKLAELAGGDEFISEVVGLSVEQLEGRLSNLAKDNERNAKAKAEDEGLLNLRAEARETAGPYNDTAKGIKMRTKYVIELIGEKGGKI